MIASLKMAHDNGLKKLKIFGRTQEMLNLFDSMLMQEAEGFSLYRQGGWLIIEDIR